MKEAAYRLWFGILVPEHTGCEKLDERSNTLPLCVGPVIRPGMPGDVESKTLNPQPVSSDLHS